MEFRVAALPSPVIGKSSRIQVVDALRGFALLGILIVHVSQWFEGGPLPTSAYQINSQDLVDEVVLLITRLFFINKFYTFFSFLFGLSFALMFTRSTDTESTFLKRFAWRLTILGLIGFVHHIHWRGDILSIYAVLGFPLLLFRNVSNRLVLTVAVLLILNLPTHLRKGYNEFFRTPQPKAESVRRQEEHIKLTEAGHRTIKTGSYLDVARVNLSGLHNKIGFQLVSGRIFITLGFFLLGLYAGRRQLFQRVTRYRPLFMKVIRYCSFAILGIALLFIVSNRILGDVTQSSGLLGLVVGILQNFSEGALTLLYIAGLTLLFQKASWQWLVSPLASIGKMALTNYVLQSVIGTLLFYGYGLGLLGEISIVVAIPLVIPIFLLQLLFSRWWLTRFQYGPLEWLWRSLTYLKVQPMRLR